MSYSKMCRGWKKFYLTGVQKNSPALNSAMNPDANMNLENILLDLELYSSWRLTRMISNGF